VIPGGQARGERAARGSEEPVHRSFDEAKQEKFGVIVAAAIGYDFSRGRLDRAVHPFETSFSRDDVRITTRFERDFLSPSLFGTMHESGHAMYEQGIGEGLEGTLLGRGASSALHESQSRLWENVVGRSRRFWQHFYPQLQETFPEPLRGLSAEEWYRHVNDVKPSLIRVEADEATYNLHIILRFEMEQEILARSIDLEDLPEAWNERMRGYLGIDVPEDRLGILQDMHWAGGHIGYFPTYALGNVISVQLWDQLRAELPDLDSQFEQGEFGELGKWLRENLHRHGRKYTSREMLERIVGGPMDPAPYLGYLRQKLGEIYGLPVETGAAKHG